MKVTCHISEPAALAALQTRAGHHPSTCPVSEAICLASRHEHAFVTIDDIHIGYDTDAAGRRRGGRYVETPDDVKTWLWAFDARRNPGPLTFEIDVPEPRKRRRYADDWDDETEDD